MMEELRHDYEACDEDDVGQIATGRITLSTILQTTLA